MRQVLATIFTLLMIAGIVYAGESKAELVPVASFVHPDAAGKLPIIGTVAVLVSGVDRQTVQLLEDALAIAVLNESIRVVYPSIQELGKERPVQPAPLEFARKIGANCLLTGSVVARCRHCSQSKHHCGDEGIRAVSLSLIDVAEDKMLVWALYEPESATGPGELSQTFVRFMVNSLKQAEKKEEQ